MSRIKWKLPSDVVMDNIMKLEVDISYQDKRVESLAAAGKADKQVALEALDLLQRALDDPNVSCGLAKTINRFLSRFKDGEDE